MLKWILAAAVAAAAIAGFAHWQHGQVKTAYVNGLPAYEWIPGRHYIFERDCYLFKLKDRPSDFPLVGDHAVVPELPVEVSEREIGASLPGVEILGVVRIGDRFKIASVRRDTGPKGTTITFEIRFADEDSHKYPRVDTFWIMDHSPEATGAAPTLLPTYVAAERLN